VKLCDLQIRYKKRIFLKDDYDKKYVLYFNFETKDMIMDLLMSYKFNKLSITDKQETEITVTRANKEYTLKQNPYVYKLNIEEFYKYGLSRGKDWRLFSKDEYQELNKDAKPKLFKRRRKHGI